MKTAKLLTELWTFLPQDTFATKSWRRCKMGWDKVMKEEFVADC